MNDNIYITINHLDDFNAFFNGKVGDILEKIFYSKKQDTFLSKFQ